MKSILGCLTALMLFSVLFSCKKESTAINSSSHWTFDSVTYKGDPATWYEDPYTPLNLNTSGSDSKTGDICDIEIFFAVRPTVSKQYTINGYWPEPDDTSSCYIYLSRSIPMDLFEWGSYVETERVNVTVNGGKITVKFTNISMEQENTLSGVYYYGKISGTLVEQ